MTKIYLDDVYRNVNRLAQNCVRVQIEHTV